MADEAELHRVARLAGPLRIALIGAMAVVTLSPAAAFLGPGIDARVAAAFPATPLPAELAPWQITAALAAGYLPILATLAALFHLVRLTGLYRAGRALAPDAARCVMAAGRALVALALLAPLARMLQILTLTATNPPGERTLAISLSSADGQAALADAVVLLVGWVLAEAARQAEENRSFV